MQWSHNACVSVLITPSGSSYNVLKTLKNRMTGCRNDNCVIKPHPCTDSNTPINSLSCLPPFTDLICSDQYHNQNRTLPCQRRKKKEKIHCCYNVYSSVLIKCTNLNLPYIVPEVLDDTFLKMERLCTVVTMKHRLCKEWVLMRQCLDYVDVCMDTCTCTVHKTTHVDELSECTLR